MSENIKKSDDGTYRWVYEFNMLKNLIILLTVLKIFLLVLEYISKRTIGNSQD